MVKLIALIISIILQFIAAFLAIRLTKVTKYRLSWILISLAFLFMAIRRCINLVQYIDEEIISEELLITYEWMGVLISFFIAAGVILIREIFYSLKKAEIERKRSEQRLLNAIIQTEEKERRRFAKDLHDGLGPLLSTVKMSVTSLLQKQSTKNDREILENTEIVINEAILSIKEISNNLSPHILNNFGLISALNSFVNKIVQAGEIQFKMDTNIENKRFDDRIEIILYRSLCELINNTLKHAHAQEILLEIFLADNLLTINYKDNGKGFIINEQGTIPESGMGIGNIKSRIKSINGNFEILSIPNHGVNAIFQIKL